MSEPTPQTGPTRRSWRRLFLAARPRLTKANLLVSVLALLLGFAIEAQVRQTSVQGLENLREEELVRILDNLDTDNQRLSTEIRQLESSALLLRSSTTRNEETRRSAQERLDALGILTGSLPARGPGVSVVLEDPAGKVTAAILLDALQELRDAGAEAVQINDVRIVASTYFADGEHAIEISGVRVTAPYRIRAIGESETLASAMAIPGGVNEQVRRVGGRSTVTPQATVEVTALHSLSSPQYARPVPQPSATP